MNIPPSYQRDRHYEPSLHDVLTALEVLSTQLDAIAKLLRESQLPPYTKPPLNSTTLLKTRRL